MIVSEQSGTEWYGTGWFAQLLLLSLLFRALTENLVIGLQLTLGYIEMLHGKAFEIFGGNMSGIFVMNSVISINLGKQGILGNLGVTCMLMCYN